MSGPVLSSVAGTSFAEPIGWPLMPLPDEGGRLRFPDLASSIRQRIECILRTTPGEQLMHPEFGAGLERVVHAQNTTALRQQVRATIEEHLAAYEQRIVVDQVLVEPSADDRALHVTIGYRIRSTGFAAQISAAVPLSVGGTA